MQMQRKYFLGLTEQRVGYMRNELHMKVPIHLLAFLPWKGQVRAEGGFSLDA